MKQIRSLSEFSCMSAYTRLYPTERISYSLFIHSTAMVRNLNGSIRPNILWSFEGISHLEDNCIQILIWGGISSDIRSEI